MWCLPVLPTKLNQTTLAVNELASRIIDLPRGIVPTTAEWVTVGVDLGKFSCTGLRSRGRRERTGTCSITAAAKSPAIR